MLAVQKKQAQFQHRMLPSGTDNHVPLWCNAPRTQHHFCGIVASNNQDLIKHQKTQTGKFTTWMDVEGIIGEISQRQIPYDLVHMWEVINK